MERTKNVSSEPHMAEHTMHYTDDVLENCIPETCIILLTNVGPINSIN